MFQWTYQETGSVVSNISQLTIYDVSISDAGAYVCTVTNDAGYGSNTSYLFSKYFHCLKIEIICVLL